MPTYIVVRPKRDLVLPSSARKAQGNQETHAAGPIKYAEGRHRIHDRCLRSSSRDTTVHTTQAVTNFPRPIRVQAAQDNHVLCLADCVRSCARAMGRIRMPHCCSRTTASAPDTSNKNCLQSTTGVMCSLFLGAPGGLFLVLGCLGELCDREPEVGSKVRSECWPELRAQGSESDDVMPLNALRFCY